MWQSKEGEYAPALMPKVAGCSYSVSALAPVAL
jgi:hypothetical protein